MLSDKVYFYYLLIHLPITILVDSTFVIPKDYQFPIQLYLHNFHIKQNNDFLAVQLELWLKAFVLFELIFQIPIFVIGPVNYLKNGMVSYSKWLYPFLNLYGFNAAFTTLICLVYVWFKGAEAGLTDQQVYKLIGVYFPTFLLPAYMVYDFTKRIIESMYENENKEKNE